jgi:hypothetical protein
MAQGSNRKKQRAHKVSKGIHGSTRHRLSEITKALLGKGMVQNEKHVPLPKSGPYKGQHVAPTGSQRFDAEQAEWNEENLPFLFNDDERGRRR